MYTPRSPISPYRHVLIIALALCAAATPARAQPSDDPSNKPGSPRSYFSTTFQGGILIPLGARAEAHQSSLAGGLRIGFTGKSGLGLDIAAEYSPLSRKNPAELERSETHLVTATVMPRFTLGKKTFRLWLAGGGGLSYERVRRFPESGPQLTDNHYGLTGSAALGFEFHPISGVGVTTIASYNRTFGPIEYELVNVTGGLVFTF